MKIYAPNKQANGVYASVHFVNGVGETDDKWLIQWFVNHGYVLGGTCEEVVDSVVTEEESSVEEPTATAENTSNEPDFEAMTPNELRQWAIENGYGNKIRNTRNKAKLLEILRG